MSKDYFFENYRMARFYDDYYGHHTGDIDFWIDITKDKQDILEIACGTGRVTLPLLKQGKNVTALDYSMEMLEVLEEKAIDYKKQLTILCQDMREFTIDKLFDVIIVTSNSLNHLEESEDLDKTFVAFSKHLKPDGIVIFDALNPYFKFLNRNKNQKYDLDEFVLSKTGEKISIYENSFYNKGTQINDVDYYYTDEKGKTIVLNTKVRLYFPKELDYIISKSNFEITNKYGWYDYRKFDGKTNEQIFMLKKTN